MIIYKGLWFYGVEHMVRDHSAREETRCRHYIGYYFRLAATYFYMHHPTDRIAHTTTFITPVVGHWLERVIAQWVHHYNSIYSLKDT